ncbi:MAG TPA: hypothetical protein VMX13_06835 [Sedimentisphaerales bacterium]|nr:hypothetical protein [Sedimentisphaerales bacterium]
MEPRQTRTQVAASVLVLAGLLVFCLYAIAGDLEPNAPPAATMHTLDEIYNAVGSTGPSILQRDGYCTYRNCGTGTTTILTVPTGRRFVLRKLWVRSSAAGWTISGGPNCDLNSTLINTNNGEVRDYMWDFPDGCVVVGGGYSLTFNNPAGGIDTIFIGYFYDVP